MSATAATSRSPASPSRRCSASGPRSRSASTRRSSGRTGTGTRPSRSARPRRSRSRRASARSSASTSSTRRCCSFRAGSRRGKVTFKYALGSDFIDKLKTIHALGMDRTDQVQREGRRRGAPRRCRGDHARPDQPRRQDVRRRAVVGTWVHRHEGRQAARDLPATRWPTPRRSGATTGSRWSAGRPASTR